MPIRTGYVKWVIPGTKGRFEVWLYEGPMTYTFDALKASLCKRACTINRPVTLATQDTSWGQKIVTAELVADTSPVPGAQEGSAA